MTALDFNPVDAAAIGAGVPPVDKTATPKVNIRISQPFTTEGYPEDAELTIAIDYPEGSSYGGYMQLSDPCHLRIVARAINHFLRLYEIEPAPSDTDYDAMIDRAISEDAEEVDDIDEANAIYLTEGFLDSTSPGDE